VLAIEKGTDEKAPQQTAGPDSIIFA
jgi:hypothetical protein